MRRRRHTVQERLELRLPILGARELRPLPRDGGHRLPQRHGEVVGEVLAGEEVRAVVSDQRGYGHGERPSNQATTASCETSTGSPATISSSVMPSAWSCSNTSRPARAASSSWGSVGWSLRAGSPMRTRLPPHEPAWWCHLSADVARAPASSRGSSGATSLMVPSPSPPHRAGPRDVAPDVVGYSPRSDGPASARTYAVSEHAVTPRFVLRLPSTR